MLKPLTLSLSLAVALGFCSVSKAGGVDKNCTTCGLASPQGGPYASGQGVACEPSCGPKKHHFSFHMPKIHCHLPKLTHTCSYEWVLKKKHNFCLTRDKCDNGCGTAAPVYGTGQGGVAPSGQVYGAGQHAFQPYKPTSAIASVPHDMTPLIGGEEAPPAPEVGSTSGGILLPTPANR